jgi:hypothetical protein
VAQHEEKREIWCNRATEVINCGDFVCIRCVCLRVWMGNVQNGGEDSKKSVVNKLNQVCNFKMAGF